MENARNITFDPAKEAANQEKHGRRDYGEPRFVTFGYIDQRLYVGVWTPRGDTFRAISVRKANDKEQKRYG